MPDPLDNSLLVVFEVRYTSSLRKSLRVLEEFYPRLLKKGFAIESFVFLNALKLPHYYPSSDPYRNTDTA